MRPLLPILLSSSLLLACGDDPTGTTSTATKVGDPAWELVDLALYSAPMGTTSTDDFYDTLRAMWPEHTVDVQNNVIVPRAVHTGHDGEISNALAANGFEESAVFSVADWTIPNGLFLSGVVVPTSAAPLGKTADWENGHMIPDAVRIAYDTDLLRDGEVVDGAFDGTSPIASEITPGVEGWSHLPMNFAENTEFVDGAAGSYEFRVKLREAGDPTKGWDVVVPFTIE
jgi:hypothetical protein